MNAIVLSTKTVLLKSLGRTGLVLQKHSPEILLGVGIAGGIAATVLACRASLEIDAIKQEFVADVMKINKGREEYTQEIYPDEAYRKDLAVTYIKTGVRYAQLYLPAIALGCFSIALIVGSHGILSKRNAALAAAYKVLDEGFKRYRERVTSELGEDSDKKFRYGPDQSKEETAPVDGEDPLSNSHKAGSPPWNSVFAREWCKETSRDFQSSYEFNEYFLRCQQNYVNDRLNIVGHVFLNEVYDRLGLKRSKEGQVIGWIKKGRGDGYIDFNITSPMNELNRKKPEQPWYLDFNVDGVIYDAI